ncbi:MAG: right-handed parallel beta-helix repeat-containing protein, partial [Candidatus Hodarchaeales archaeon]
MGNYLLKTSSKWIILALTLGVLLNPIIYADNTISSEIIDDSNSTEEERTHIEENEGEWVGDQESPGKTLDSVNSIQEVENESSIFIIEDTIFDSREFLVNENITVTNNSSLTLNNVTIKFNGTENEHGIIIENGSSIKINNSKINVADTQLEYWYLFADHPETVEINSSIFSNAGIAGPLNRTGLTIINCTQKISLVNLSLSDCYNSINIINCTGLLFDHGTIEGSSNGIYLENSIDIEISRLSFQNLDNYAIYSNNCSNIGLYDSSSNFIQQDGDSPAIRITNSSIIDIINNTFYNHGIDVVECFDIQIRNNYLSAVEIEEQEEGIRIRNSSAVIIRNNVITGAETAFNAIGGYARSISVSGSPGNNITIEYNNIDNFAGWGIATTDCVDLLIAGNSIEKGKMNDYFDDSWNEPAGGVGLFLGSGQGEEIIKNNTLVELPLAIYFENISSKSVDFSDTVIYLNNFVDNDRDYDDDNLILNLDWNRDNIGNYWSQCNGTDPDGNGIINQPYDLLGDGSAYDYHPLFFPNYNPKITLETITAILVENRIGQFINWTIEDDDYQNYIVVENGSTIIQESLDDNNVTISLDGLTQGNYTIICTVTDRWGNNGTNSVDFHVDPADYDDPFLDAPSDLLVRELDPEYEINWNASDAHPSKYNVTLNDTLYIEEDWTGGNITFTLESLEEEIYIMNLSIYDVLDHKTSQLITVNVTDFGPVIIGTDNITLAQDDTTTVKWTLY